MHPDYDDQDLAADQCGKHESWLVLEAKEGSGFYLGLKPGTDKKQIKQSLRCNEDFSKLLNFIPAKEGEYYDLLLEPFMQLAKA